MCVTKIIFQASEFFTNLFSKKKKQFTRNRYPMRFIQTFEIGQILVVVGALPHGQIIFQTLSDFQQALVKKDEKKSPNSNENTFFCVPNETLGLLGIVGDYGKGYRVEPFEAGTHKKLVKTNLSITQ